MPRLSAEDEKEIKRIRSLPERQFVQEYEIAVKEMTESSITNEILDKLYLRLHLLIAGATDIQLLARAKHDNVGYFKNSDPAGLEEYLKELWDARSLAAAEVGLRDESLGRYPDFTRLAKEIIRLHEMHRELTEHPEIIERLGRKMGDSALR